VASGLGVPNSWRSPPRADRTLIHHNKNFEEDDMIHTIKSVLVGVTEQFSEGQTSSALTYGLSLAERAGAHVTVHAASLKLTLPTGWVTRFASSLLSAENKRLDAVAKHVAEVVRSEAEAVGVTCSVETPQAPYHELVADFTRQARVHDLVVIDSEPDTWKVDRGMIEALLTDTGKPVLVVPPAKTAFACERIVVAWDETARAARAVGDALPFLRAAKSVTILTVHGEKNLSHAVPGADLARFLSRHGVSADVEDVKVMDGDVAKTIRAAAQRLDADLIVMGGYAHSRLRQIVFGGVTQSLLNDCAYPLMLSH
jgi:nucleotide-binding universal stress UspA family protein